MPNKKILYCGDNNLKDAARYLAGSLKYLGLGFDYLGSQEKPHADTFQKKHALYILSDYPSSRLSARHMRAIEQDIYEGASCLMIGGWASFHGLDGRYEKTSIQNLLPVHCLKSDDRAQGAHTYRMVKTSKNNFFKRLDFSAAPGLAGYNMVRTKNTAREILSIETLRINAQNNKAQVTRKDPLLALAGFGMGRIAAFTTDLAPHWAGGLVDWGKQRIRIKVGPKNEIEVGEDYLRFVEELLGILL